MQFEVRLPRLFTPHTEGERLVSVETEGNTIGDVLHAVVNQYPALDGSIFSDGELHHHLNVFVDHDDIRYLGGLSLELVDGKQEIALIPAIAGGI